MNILIPHTWLLEHLETEASPEEIQKYLSLSGPSVERIYEREGESVYDIEVTTNRVDSMSVRGIAREAAVILPQFGVAAKLKPLNIPKKLEITGEPLPLPLVKNDPTLCKRVMGAVLSNVKHTPTPDWMAKRLRQIDANVHDSMIDITNYVTHELGHPCHAFDYDALMKLGGEIIITEAKAGKKFTTLDGVEYTTVGGEVVFENPQGEIIDLPGIKGTANSSITDHTTNVLLELEAIDHQKIRFASMTHAIRTVAAQLNEKQVDPHLAEPTLHEGAKYYQELCEAKVASEVYDDFPGRVEPRSISVPLAQIDTYLGISLGKDKMIDILERLECAVTLSKDGKNLVVQPPTFRPDLEIPADVIEEIARIYGYHELPSVLMPTAIPLNKPEYLNFTAENTIKHFLADIGWQEIYSYSMVSEEQATASGYTLGQHLKLANPLTDDKIFLRRSLIPSLTEIIDQNPQQSSLSVFEIANVYIPVKGDLPTEELHLTMVSTKEFKQVKGDLEALLSRFYVRNTSVKPAKNIRVLAHAGTITAENGQGEVVEIGHLGNLPNGYSAVDIIISKLWEVINSHPAYQSIPKTAAIVEDMTFTLPTKTLVGEVLDTIKTISPFITDVSLADTYQQNYTLRVTYLNQETNISAQEVEPLRKKIAALVSHDFKGQLVGSI